MRFVILLLAAITVSGCVGPVKAVDRALTPCGHIWYSKEETEKVWNSPECVKYREGKNLKSRGPGAGNDGIVGAMPTWF